MSLITGGLNLLENHLPKVIDARTHGVIDYGHATFFSVWQQSAANEIPGQQRQR